MHLRATGHRLSQFALLALFFLSGASSLIFETLWQRQMILVFGASAPATAAILMAFFIGLAIGSYVGGILLERSEKALRFYALVELWIGAWSLTVPPLLGAVGEVLKTLGDTNEVTALPYLIRLGLSVAIVLPATMGMGATVPVMNRLINERGCAFGKSAAIAYGLNTLGAVTGCLITGYLLVRYLGVQQSLHLALMLNGLVLISSLLLNRTSGTPPSDAAPKGPLGVPSVSTGGLEATYNRWLAPLLIGLYFASGFLALGYEVVWLRILSIYTATSSTTFAIVLAVYLLGFSTGSLLLYPALAKRMSGRRIFLLSNLSTGLLALAMTPLFYTFPMLRYEIAFSGGGQKYRSPFSDSPRLNSCTPSSWCTCPRRRWGWRSRRCARLWSSLAQLSAERAASTTSSATWEPPLA